METKTDCSSLKSSSELRKEMGVFKRLFLNNEVRNKIYEVVNKGFNGKTVKIGDSFNPSGLPNIQNQDIGSLVYGNQGSNFLSGRTITWNPIAIDNAIRGIPYLEKSSVWKMQKALENGVDLNSKTVPYNELYKVNNYLRKLSNSIEKYGVLGDLFGGSAALMVFKGQSSVEDYEKPLDFKKIKKGSFQGLLPLSRWYQINPCLEFRVTENDLNEEIGITGENLGQPLYYYVNFTRDTLANNNHFKVHRSRIFIYNSMILSSLEEQKELYWGPSSLEKLIVDLSRYEDLTSQVVKLVNRSNIPVINKELLASQVLEAGQEVGDEIASVITQIAVAIEMGGLVVLGSKEDEAFEYHNANLQHTKELLDEYKATLSSLLGAPQNVILGKTDAKPEDEKMFYDEPIKIQNKYLMPMYDILVKVIYKSIFGKYEDDFTIKFKSLDRMTELEKAEKQNLVVDTLSVLYNDNVIDAVSYIDMLKSAQNNVGDIFEEINKLWLEHIKPKDNVFFTKNKTDIELAVALNHNKNNENGNSMQHNSSNAQKGKALGGNQKRTKKATSTLKINKGE